MKNYELTYLLPPDFTEEQTKELQNRVVFLIHQNEGGLLGGVEESLILKKNLAYPVKKYNLAYLSVLNFQLKPENLVNLEKKLKEENNILRYLILAKKKEIAPKIPRVAIFRKKPKKVVSEKKVDLKEIEEKLEEILKE